MTFLPLLGKDVRVLLRSRALVALLILYPLLLAGIVTALTRDAGSRPRVAYVDEAGLSGKLDVGETSLDYDALKRRVEERVELVPMTADQAQSALERGDVVASVTIPSGFLPTLRGMLSSPQIVLETRGGVVGERALREMQSFVYDLNNQLQGEFLRANIDYLKLLVEGGSTNFLGREVSILGLDKTAEIVQEQRARATSDEDRAALDQILGFANDAKLALGFANASLEAVAHPVELKEERLGGAAGLLENRAIALVIAVGICLTGVLLGAGGLAAERDEGTLPRLLRGRVRIGSLLGEKIALVALVGLVLGIALELAYAVTAALVDVGPEQPWARLPLVGLVVLVASAAVGAVGVLAGALVRDLAASALLAVLVTIPFLLVGLIPGEISPLLTAASAVFPFEATVDALAGVLYDPTPWSALGHGLLHLAILAVLYFAAARVAARRLGA